MTKLEQLRATVEALTASPWEARGNEVWSVDESHPDYDMRLVLAGRPTETTSADPINHRDAIPNAAGIAALRNAATELLDLACLVTQLKRWQDGEDRQGADLDAILDSCVSALTRLEDSLP